MECQFSLALVRPAAESWDITQIWESTTSWHFHSPKWMEWPGWTTAFCENKFMKVNYHQFYSRHYSILQNVMILFLKLTPLMNALISDWMDAVGSPHLSFSMRRGALSFAETSMKIKYSKLLIKNGFKEWEGYGFICMNATIWVCTVALCSREKPHHFW